MTLNIFKYAESNMRNTSESDTRLATRLPMYTLRTVSPKESYGLLERTDVDLFFLIELLFWK